MTRRNAGMARRLWPCAVGPYLRVLVVAALALFLAQRAEALTKTVQVGPGHTLTFLDTVSGTETTTINVGDIVQWDWVNGFHSTSGVTPAEFSSPRTAVNHGGFPGLANTREENRRSALAGGKEASFRKFCLDRVDRPDLGEDTLHMHRLAHSRVGVGYIAQVLGTGHAGGGAAALVFCLSRALGRPAVARASPLPSPPNPLVGFNSRERSTQRPQLVLAVRP